MAVSAAGEAPHFLSTCDSSLMWSSGVGGPTYSRGVCKDADCTGEHVPGVKTLDGARVHKLDFGANVLVVIAAGTTFAPAKSQILQKLTETTAVIGFMALQCMSLVVPRCGEMVLEDIQRTEPEVLHKFNDLLCNRASSTVEEGQDEQRRIVHIVAFSGILGSSSSMVTYLAPPRFTDVDPQQRREAILALTSFPAPIESIIADFEVRRTIQDMGSDFYDIFTRGLPLSRDDDPCFDKRLATFKPPEESGWELYAGKADAAASATAAAGTAANATKEEGK